MRTTKMKKMGSRIGRRHVLNIWVVALEIEDPN
jgi:hypothetical protein